VALSERLADLKADSEGRGSCDAHRIDGFGPRLAKLSKLSTALSACFPCVAFVSVAREGGRGGREGRAGRAGPGRAMSGPAGCAWRLWPGGMGGRAGLTRSGHQLIPRGNGRLPSYWRSIFTRLSTPEPP
jgi:hypothetical protein